MDFSFGRPMLTWDARARTRPLAALYVAGAGLLAATGGIHLDLYLNGYGPVPTIGPLFLVQSAVAFALAVALLATRHPLTAVAGALFALATLGGYLLSLIVGLFGFKEVPTAAGAWAGGLEVAGFAVLSGAAALALPVDRRRLAARLSAPLTGGGALALALGLVLVQPTGASATAGGAGQRPSVLVVSVPGYGAVLATPQKTSLYLLSDEKGGRLECTSGCLSIWPPLLLAKGAGAPRAGAGMKGRLGVVRRGRLEQVTYNGYPLYTYAGDPGPQASTGQGIVSNGGTWYLVRASARSAGSTAVTKRS